MVGPWPHLRDFARWAALKFAILQHSEVHTADGDAREINADVAIHGRGIRAVRQMPRLLALHLVDVLHWKLVAPVGATREGRVFAALTPDVAMADIVVVRDANSGPVSE